MSIKKQVESVLRDLNIKTPEVEASVVLTNDGLVVASILKDGIQPERVAAMCGALLGLADTAGQELDKGALKLLLLHGENGVLLLIHVGNSYVLAISASTEIKLGAALVEAKQTASKILQLTTGS